ncbi:MAG TPA: ferredoxin [Sedimenticola sp.]|nr:ferredoxin [Sedimenticola sp.]
MTARAIKEQPAQEAENKAAGLPVLPAVIADAAASEELMGILRRFHLGEPGARAKVGEVNSDFLPVSLNSFRDVSRVRYDYPLFLSPAEKAQDGPLAKPLSRFLGDAVEGFAPGAESARILKDNLAWLERELCGKMHGRERPAEAAPLFADAASALQEHLNLSEEHRERLQADLDKLMAAVEPGSQLLGYGRYAAIHLLIHTVRSKTAPRRAAFREEIQELKGSLKALLEVEKEKSASARKPGAIKGSVGAASSYFDASAFSKMISHAQGSIAMAPKRRKRIEGALKALEGYQEDPILIHFVHVDKLADTWLDEAPEFETVQDADPCQAAAAIFDREAARLAKVFAAARIARLEIAGKYDAAVHDPWFKDFGWEGFSRQELLLVPTIAALENAARIGGEGLPSLSRLLNSGRHVQVLARVQPHNNPGARDDEDPFKSYRLELGYLGISHRQAVVSQSSAARYDHLLAQYDLALEATRSGLHLLSTGAQPASDDALDPWFVASAALEGRAHPFFRVDPQAGDDAASRMDFSCNPQPEQDWPLHSYSYQEASGEVVDSELVFTFADYALVVSRLHSHFGLIPAGCVSDNLVPVAQWLAMSEEQANDCIPFVWAVDGKGVLHRLAITRALVMACQDRRNFWRTLQELAGVRNRYAELAAQKATEEAQAAAAAEIESILKEHAEELERVRTETAGEALGRLADALVGLDLSAMAPAASAAAPKAAPAEAPAAAPAQEAAAPEPEAAPEAAPEPEEEEVSFDEPWIETILCTSCNDCINLNPQMFVYNDDKQAYIADPKAGTYAQLVEAAEFCPANCIHPGKPLNPDEPGLEELIKRAEAYN